MSLGDAAAVEAWLVARVASQRGLAPGAIDLNERLTRYGVDSIGAAALIAALSEAIRNENENARPLSPVLFWEFPSIASLAAHVTGAPAAPRRSSSRRSGVHEAEPIAVVGLACRMPKAPSPEAYWDLLARGGDAVTEVPADRWDVASVYDADATRPGKANTKWGAFLDEIDRFEPVFFGISPREAALIDPQQRLMLELSWEALEDAGIAPASLRETATSVFGAAIWMDYAVLTHADRTLIAQHTATGFHHSIVANRVSYVLGLQGPSYAVDAACASSLVGVHLACESLRTGESTVALVGGANVMVDPNATIDMSKLGALSPDGRCFTFDARANGYVRGEGGAVLVLKRLSRALADGDRIRCVIRGSAVNNDGASNGLTAPNVRAQIALLEAAYARSGVAPREVDYIEAHGTGTQVGDPIEASALGAVLGAGAGRDRQRPLLVGSTKTNIGHLEAAAGVAGLVKLALSIEHGAVPPSCHYVTPNPNIRFEELGLAVNTRLAPWPSGDAPRRAGVSSFGFGGTNAHVVVEEWRPTRPELFTFAAETAAERDRLVEALRADAAGATRLETLSRGVTAGAERAAVVASSPSELARRLEGLARGEPGAGVQVQVARSAESRGPVFVFSGMGSQWVGMGRSLLDSEPVFRRAIEECDAHLHALAGWSVVDVLRSSSGGRLDEVDVFSPTIVAMEIALAALYRAYGVEPSAVIGHSIGESAAACVAGVISVAEAMRVVSGQTRPLRRLQGNGELGLVALSWSETERALLPHAGRLFRAIHLSPTSTVVSGEPGALAELFAELERRGVFCRRVHAGVPAHCPLLDPIRSEICEAIGTIAPRTPTIAVVPTTKTGPAPLFDTAYWVRNICDAGDFLQAVEAVSAGGASTFVEVSPQPLVTRAIEATTERSAVVLATLRRDEPERAVMLETIGALFVRGHGIDWDAVDGASRGRALRTAPGGRRRPQLVTASARTPSSLLSQAERLAAHIEAEPSLCVADVATTTALGRDHLEHRLAVVAEDREELIRALRGFARGEPPAGVAIGRRSPSARPKIAFVFSGQGSQWEGMGKELLQERAFSEKLGECDEMIRAEGGFSVMEAVTRLGQESRLVEIEVVQPTLFAMAVSLAALWRSWGVEPSAVVGHSLGEVAAAYVSGALSMRDAARVICTRSRLVRRTVGRGGMIAAELSAKEAEALVVRWGGRVEVAADNGPRTVLLSGETEALAEAKRTLEERGVFVRAVKVDYASHCAQMDELGPDLRRELSSVSPRPGAVPIYSTLTGEVEDGSRLGTEYWVRNLRERVRFAGAIERLVASGHHLFVEVSPHPVLAAAIEPMLSAGQRVVGTLRREQPSRRQMLESLGTLHVNGYDGTRWRELGADGRRAALPTYAWERERYWVEAPKAARRTAAGHPLLGERVEVSTDPGTHVWETELREEGYFPEHRVLDATVLPGAAYVEMALRGATEVFVAPVSLEDVTLTEPLVLVENEATRLQLVMKATGGSDGRASFTVSSRRADASAWTAHARGTVARAPDGALLEHGVAERAAEGEPEWTESGIAGRSQRRSEEVRRRPNRIERRMTGAEHYETLAARGLTYGDAFRGVEEIVVQRGSAWGRLRATDAVRAEAGGYGWHPALLDAAIQVALPAADAGAGAGGRGTWVPAGMRKIVATSPAPRLGEGATLAVRAALTGKAEVDVEVRGPDGAACLRIEGLRLAELRDAARDVVGSWFYEIVWEPRPRPEAPGSSALGALGAWLIVADEGGRWRGIEAGLAARGAEVSVVPASERGGYARHLAAHGAKLRGVVHAGGLDVSADLEHAQEQGVLSVLGLIQATAELGLRDPPRIWILTGDARTMSGVAHSPLWGLCRVATHEHPELRCTVLDVDDLAPPEALCLELIAGDREDLVLLRGPSGEERLVPRLQRLREPPPRSEAAVDAQGVWLVTGGLGALGLAVAERLVVRGATKLALVGRSAPSPEALAAIARMRDDGADVRTYAGDVAREEDVARVVASVRGELGPIRGIVHSAGILDDRTILRDDPARFVRVMAPKVRGAWNLLAAAGDEAERVFFFSSVAALVGSGGQANYAAGNAFLDALAAARRRAGRHALSIQWGAWAEIGLAAAQANRGERLAGEGMASMTPEEGLEAFERAIQSDAAQIGVLPWDPRQWIELHPTAARSPFFDVVRQAVRAVSAGRGDAQLIAELAAQPSAVRQERLEAFLRRAVGVVLRLDAERVTPDAPFGSIGLDSLLGLEIRNRLEASLGLTLPATLLWTHNTIEKLARELLLRLFPPDEAKVPEHAEEPSPGAPLAREEAARLLAAELAELADLEAEDS